MYLHREWKESGIPVSHHMGDEQNNVYQFLRYFDKLYDKFTDLEKKSFKQLVERTYNYEQEQPDSRATHKKATSFLCSSFVNPLRDSQF